MALSLGPLLPGGNVRRGDFRDPAVVLERRQERTCLGCSKLLKDMWGGTAKYVCRIGVQKAALDVYEMRRCRKYSYGVTMTQDQSEQIEELLREWHHWQDGYRPALGGPRCDPTCRDYRSGDRFLTAREKAEIADEKMRKMRSEQVDVCVDALTWQQRAAIHTSMRNKQCGHSVWSTGEAGDRHEIYQQAKEALLPMLMKRQLIKAEQIATA